MKSWLMRNVVFFVGVSVLLVAADAVAAIADDRLASAFVSPPNSARPWVYWFALDGNITTSGMTADLEAMKRVGIGGALYMETAQGTPKGKAAFAGPEWRALFKHACTEAARLGLELNMNNDAGWCGSGGPWIKPEESMQKVVYEETAVQGPRHVDEILTQPAATAGYYRDICVQAIPAVDPSDYIANIAEKSALRPVGYTLPALSSGMTTATGIARKGIIDLTTRMNAEGRLTWDAPAGNWTIVRFGHTST